jgi:hypothetical protein
MIRQRNGRGNDGRALRWLLALVLAGGALFIWHEHAASPGMGVAGDNLPAGVASPTPPPAAPAGATRDVALWPFQAHSPWNAPLATTAAFAGPDAACTRDLTDPSVTVFMSTNNWSHAVFLAKASDPWAQIRYDPAAHVPRTGVIATIRIPANATPSPPAADQGGDARIYIIDPTHHYVDEMWKATKNPDGSWRAWSYKRNDLFGAGIGQGGMRAYGGSGLGGLIRLGELTNGIHHALAIAVPRAKEVNSWVWPAVANDVDGKPDPEYQGAIPMGQLVALPPQIDVSRLGLSPQGLVLAHALQDYGAYIADSSSDYAYYADTPVYHELNGPAVNHHDLPLLHHLLQCITSNSAATVGGGAPSAPRLAPWASWLPGEAHHP